jgi:oxygen-independent coproporphyrinogen-3 oxidase
MYERLCERTGEAGYEQYEISNFARRPDPPTDPLDLRSQHNLKYWTGAAFYGMGCGAHSYDGQARWHNTLKTETYIDQIEATGSAIADREELSDEMRAVEALFMALRLTEGVGLEEFRESYGLDALERLRDDLPRLREAGLITVNEGRLALTSRGRLLSNEVFVSII